MTNLKIFLCAILFLLSFSKGQSQSLEVGDLVRPIDSCNLGTDVQLQVTYIKNGTYFLPNFATSYQIDGNPKVYETIPNGGWLSWPKTFVNKTNDLASYGNHVIEACISEDNFVSDSTCKTFNIKNDSPVSKGALSGTLNVCELGNNDSVVLSGHDYEVALWKFSYDQVSWDTIPGYTDSVVRYLNMNNSTYYKAIVKSIYDICPRDSTDDFKVTVDRASYPGDVSNDTAVCVSGNIGSVRTENNNGIILDWESSLDGVLYTSMGTSFPVVGYSNLSQTTWYKVKTINGTCPSNFSDPIKITVDSVTLRGSLFNTDSVVCAYYNTGNAKLLGSRGTISWERSGLSGPWVNAGQTDTILNYSSEYDTTLFRASIKNGACSQEYSDVFTLNVNDTTIGGAIDGYAICISDGSAVLNLNSNRGNVLNWESSIDTGATWNNIINFSSSYNASGLTQNTVYRAQVQSGVCPPKYSDTGFVRVDSTTLPGVISVGIEFCEDSVEGFVYISGYRGDLLFWNSSEDEFASYDTINTTSDSIYFSDLLVTTAYRAVIKNGVCYQVYSDSSIATVHPLPSVFAGGTIDEIVEGDSVQLNGSGSGSPIWSGDTSITDTLIFTPYVKPFTETMYTLTIIDVNGCVNSDSVIVPVRSPFPKFDLITNTITANGDGINDHFLINGLHKYPGSTLTIFNQHGQVIYEQYEYQNDWDGKLNGDYLPNGTYFYLLTFDEYEEQFKGSITVLRD